MRHLLESRSALVSATKSTADFSNTTQLTHKTAHSQRVLSEQARGARLDGFALNASSNGRRARRYPIAASSVGIA
ncbi:hypothetical protein GCM10023333_02900 [Ferrimonas pelagia]|uniref:Uncharacterized protein n=1 Tax=Ferrimonas pelagia TaxID=1177826 RepID=A0ABP9ECZ9_9GAMM